MVVVHLLSFTHRRLLVDRKNKRCEMHWMRFPCKAVQSDDGMMGRQEMVMCECELVGKWKVGGAEHHDISYWAQDVEMTLGIWKMAGELEARVWQNKRQARDGYTWGRRKQKRRDETR